MRKTISSSRISIAPSVKILAFLLSPVLGFLAILPSLNTRSSRIILFFIFLVIAYCFVVPENATEDMNFDCIRYREDFENSARITTHEFLNDLKSYVTLSGKSDFYADTIYYIVSRFTSNYHYMFLLVAIVFSFFNIKLLKFFVLNSRYNFFSIGSLLLLYLFSINQIFYINIFRFGTAAIIAIYSLFQICVNSDKRYYSLLFITPLIHGSFILLGVIYVIKVVVYSNNKLLKVAFLFSFFASVFMEIFVGLMRQFIEYLPDFLYSKFHYYLGSEYVDYINNGGSGFMWMRRLVQTFLVIVINMGIYLLLICKKRVEKGRYELYKWMLATMIFVNMTLMIPSVGSRFICIVTPIFAYLWLDLDMLKYNRIYTRLLNSCILLLVVIPIPIYIFPCWFDYLKMLDYNFILSPIYSMTKYLICC